VCVGVWCHAGPSMCACVCMVGRRVEQHAELSAEGVSSVAIGREGGGSDFTAADWSRSPQP